MARSVHLPVFVRRTFVVAMFLSLAAVLPVVPRAVAPVGAATGTFPAADDEIQVEVLTPPSFTVFRTSAGDRLSAAALRDPETAPYAGPVPRTFGGQAPVLPGGLKEVNTGNWDSDDGLEVLAVTDAGVVFLFDDPSHDHVELGRAAFGARAATFADLGTSGLDHLADGLDGKAEIVVATAANTFEVFSSEVPDRTWEPFASRNRYADYSGGMIHPGGLPTVDLTVAEGEPALLFTVRGNGGFQTFVTGRLWRRELGFVDDLLVHSTPGWGGPAGGEDVAASVRARVRSRANGRNEGEVVVASAKANGNMTIATVALRSSGGQDVVPLALDLAGCHSPAGAPFAWVPPRGPGAGLGYLACPIGAPVGSNAAHLRVFGITPTVDGYDVQHGDVVLPLGPGVAADPLFGTPQLEMRIWSDEFTPPLVDVELTVPAQMQDHTRRLLQTGARITYWVQNEEYTARPVGSVHRIGGALLDDDEAHFAMVRMETGTTKATARRDLEEDASCASVGAGRHEVCTVIPSAGRPIAIMAAPPNVPGLQQEFVSPTFVSGRSYGSSSSASSSLELRAGLGFEVEVDFINTEASVEATVTGSTTYTKEQFYEVSFSELYFGAVDQNTVVYTEDQMYGASYRIVDTPDGYGVGEAFKLFLPKRSVVTQLPAPEYFGRFGDQAFTESEFERFMPVPGDFDTYPALDGNPSSLGCASSPTALKGAVHTVQMGGQGVGADSSSIRIGKGTTNTSEWNLELGFDASLKVGGVTGTWGVSFGFGGSTSTTAGTETGFDGYVGHIPFLQKDLGSDERYDWRLLMCRIELGGVPVWMSTFEVGGYNGRGGYDAAEVAIVSPVDFADTTNRPQLRWTATGLLRQVQVEIDRLDGPGGRLVDIPVGGPHYSWQPEADDALQSGDYRWRVTAEDLLGDTATTEWETFRVWNPLGPPTLLVPLVESDRSLRIDWTAGTGAAGATYDVAVRRIGDPTLENVWSRTGIEGTSVRTSPLPLGSYAVVIQAKNRLHASEVDSESVTISTDAPRARFHLSASETTRLEDVQFTDESFDLDGNVVSWTWDFGDGSTATSQSPSHRFTTVGRHEVRLTVTDDDGASGSISRIVTVRNLVPSVEVEVGPTEPSRLDDVSFTATATDPEGDALSYVWDLGDGTARTGAEVSHRYGTVGRHDVTVVVTDAAGAAVAVKERVDVRNLPPAAGFDASPSAPLTGDMVQLRSTATDPEGLPLTTTWVLDGDVLTGDLVERAFAKPGIQLVQQVVTDDAGATATAIKVVFVQNRPPSVDFGWSPETPTDLETVQFTATASDADGRVVRHEWDFGDGASSTKPNPTHRFADDGDYEVTLTVTDDVGGVTAISKVITVTNVPPVAGFGWSDKVPSLQSAVKFTDASSDPDGKVVAWHWDFGDGTTGTGPNPTHKYRKCGIYTVTQTVTDDDGATATASKKLAVEPLATNLGLSSTFLCPGGR